MVKYRTGWSALQVPNKHGNADWHSNMANLKWRESDGSYFGDYGIEYLDGMYEGYNANHIRAILDLLEEGQVLGLQGVQDIIELDDDEQLELCKLVYERYGMVLDFFMFREFRWAWVTYRRSIGQKVDLPASRVMLTYKNGKYAHLVKKWRLDV